MPGGRLIPDSPGIFQAGVIFRLAGATQGRLAGICPRAVRLPVSAVAGKREPQACLAQARHQDPARRGYAVMQSTTPAVQAMNTAIATNWHVAAAQTKA